MYKYDRLYVRMMSEVLKEYRQTLLAWMDLREKCPYKQGGRCHLTRGLCEIEGCLLPKEEEFKEMANDITIDDGAEMAAYFGELY